MEETIKSSTKAEKYIFSRDAFRKKHQNDFLRKNEEINLLVVSINELIASLTLFLSEKDLRTIENGLYNGDLIVSYCRSHFIASDLLLGGELVETAIIIRKQMELLSRLNELSNGVDIEKLIQKTPNLKNLKTGLKRMYSEYSEIAHSASPSIMQILGKKEIEGKRYTLLYPEFQDNSYVTLHHLALCAFEFYIWCTDFLVDNFSEYDDTYDSILFKNAFEQCEKIYK